MAASIHSCSLHTDSPTAFPAAPSHGTLANAMSNKIARYLITAAERTASGGSEFLLGLKSMRDAWIQDLGAKELNLLTQDGDTINGLHFAGTQKKAIIHIHGNGCFYETSLQRPLSWVEALKETSPESKQPHLVVFNPRGTGKSEGTIHPDRVALDVLAAFEYLVREEGIDPSDIVISGHSMGGLWAALGAALIQTRYPDASIHCLSDRSFGSIHSRLDMKTQSSPSLASISLFNRTLHKLLSATGWDRNPIDALHQLKGRVCILYHEGDGVVPYHTSLHSVLVRSDRKRTFSCLSLHPEKERLEASYHAAQAHNRDFDEIERTQVLAEVKRMLRLPLTEREESLPLVELPKTIES